MENKDKFEYDYSSISDEQKEQVELIQQKYENQKVEKNEQEKLLDQIKKLDSKVESSGLILSLCFGVVGTLIFGLGMSFVMVWDKMWLGIVIGVIGAILIGLAYPVHTLAYKKSKAKYGNQIVELSSKLLNQKQAEKKD